MISPTATSSNDPETSASSGGYDLGAGGDEPPAFPATPDMRAPSYDPS